MSHTAYRPAFFMRRRRHTGVCAAGSFFSFFVAALLLCASAAVADVVMESGDQRFSLDSPGAQPPAGNNDAPIPGGRAENTPDRSRQEGESPLPWGVVPEVYIPWQPKKSQRPPYPNTGPSQRPGGAPVRVNPGSVRPLKPSEQKTGRESYGHPGLRQQNMTSGLERNIHRQGQARFSNTMVVSAAAGVYTPGSGGPVFGAGGRTGPAAQSGSFRPPTATPSTSGVTGSPPGSLPRPSSGFSDTAPIGAPERKLYPGMRPPLMGNTPQPVYPGEKPYAPGRK